MRAFSIDIIKVRCQNTKARKQNTSSDINLNEKIFNNKRSIKFSDLLFLHTLQIKWVIYEYTFYNVILLEII